MTEIRQCPQCDAELPADAPEGVCPKCLMQLGFESREQSAGEPGDPTVIGSGFVAPSVEKLAEHFPQLEIIELLGKGGMGAVYKARQPSLDRLVALKILPPEIGKDPAFAERFMREARALAMLNHTCIVAVYDFGEADGLYYFVMEYVDGANLRQTIEAGGLQPKEALAIVPQICDALQFAHEEGVVHRDIKPENVLIDKRGRVKIADFGLAKLLGVDAENSPGEKPFTLTGTNQVMGTLQYMAPEQMRGSHDVDHRADIYSLGVVFYEMLTGELPIGRFQPPSKKVQVDVRLDEVVLRSLESEPERRYQHASDVKKEVESILTTAGILPPAAQSISTADNALVRGRLKVPAIGLLVAGIVNLLATLSIVLIPVVITLLSNGKGMGIPGPTELLVVACSLAMGTMLIAGAVRMFDLQSHRIAVIAAVIAVLPCTLGFLISLPFGIWALIVLSKPDVQDAFAGHGQLPQSPTRVPQSSTMEAVAGKGNAPTAALPAGAGPAPVSSSTWESVPPRFSRKAIWGAAWAPLFFIVAFGSVYLQTVRQVNSSTMSGSSITETTSRPVGSSVSTTTPPPATVIDRQTPSPGPEWWQWVLICTALPLGLAAPFGTTILGTIAISDIRHSQNRLVGLPLAVGDALLFPLLLLDVLICFVVAALVSIGISTIQDVMGIEGSHAGVNVMLPMLVALPMAILVDVLICRAVWRKASRPLHEPTDSETPHGTDEADAVCRQLRGPGIGLVFTGIANWLVLPFLIAMSSYLSLAEPAPGPSATVFGSVAAAIFVFSALMIFSGLRIMRCESRGLGIFAAVLAMIVTPGNVIGFPIGIWALVALSGSDVKDAFKRKEADSGSNGSFTGWAILLVVLAIGSVVGLGVSAYLNNGNKTGNASGESNADELIDFTVQSQDGHPTFTFDGVTMVFEGIETENNNTQSGGQMPADGGGKVTIDIAGRGVGITGTSGPAGVNSVSVNGYSFELHRNCTQLWPLFPERGAPLDLGILTRPLTIWIDGDGIYRLQEQPVTPTAPDSQPAESEEN